MDTKYASVNDLITKEHLEEPEPMLERNDTPPKVKPGDTIEVAFVDFMEIEKLVETDDGVFLVCIDCNDKRHVLEHKNIVAKTKELTEEKINYRKE